MLVRRSKTRSPNDCIEKGVKKHLVLTTTFRSSVVNPNRKDLLKAIQ